MPTGNPLEQLRRRMQSHATPAAFAALAEEHRRAGRLDEAIAVCRDGLARYPAYVSARVTLGRALFDAGDVAGAVAELELAVAQAPDNFAAVRALEAARAAGPVAAPRITAPPDLALHAPPADDTADIPADLVARAMGSGVDGPQEFGLGPDWLPAPPLPAPPLPQSSVGLAPGPSPEADTAVEFAHGDAPTMCFTPPHLQGDEPAGIWPVPSSHASVDPITDAAPVFSWALDPPTGEGSHDSSPHEPSPQPPAAVPVWDAPTIDAPLVSLVAPDEAPPPEPSPAAWVPTPAVAPEAAEAPDVVAAAAPSEPSPFWSDLGEAGVGASDPVPFSGWHEPAPPETGAAPPVASWADEVATGAWAVQDGPSAAWTLPGPDEVSTTPFQDVLGEEVERPVPASFTGREVTGVDPVPFGDAAPAERPASPWQGSLASALDEVFAQAGTPARAAESLPPGIGALRLAMADAAVEVALTEAGASLEPPTSQVTAVRMAMADVAVEAAIEDAAQGEATPALVSLEQLLAAVRARRASLFSTLPS